MSLGSPLSNTSVRVSLLVIVKGERTEEVRFHKFEDNIDSFDTISRVDSPIIDSSEPGIVKLESKQFERDPAVRADVLKRANGICESCKKTAPFKKSNGQPFLEVHHVVPMSEGGADTIENVVALCPNCHREAHFGSVTQRLPNEPLAVSFKKIEQSEFNLSVDYHYEQALGLLAKELEFVRDQDLRLFLDIANIPELESREDIPIKVLIPAFIISELRRAFEIGFLVFIPFFV